MAGEKPKSYDEKQRLAIDTDATAIVSAGAGSGKTTVLSARYLRLVRDKGLPVDSILALTFTKKATSEMFGRIHGELARDGSQRVREQLARFGEAQISTLDSFCARVSRSGCPAWGFSPGFVADDEPALELAEAEALAFALEKRDVPIVKRLIARHGFERVCQDLFAKAALRMCPACPCDFKSMPAELEAHLRAELERARNRLAELRDAARADGIDKAPKTYPSLFDREIPAAESEDFLRLLAALGSTRCVNSGQPFHEESREIKSVCVLASIAGRTLRSLPEYEPLYGLLAEYQERVISAKRSANVLSFTDSARMAREVLVSDPALRAYYKGRFKAIMIDEFQDDNLLQKEILYLLAEDPRRMERRVPGADRIVPGKLFFVGDEKQSIYRFRGADVSVFRRLSSELGKSAQAIELSMNYRSEPALIEFFNALFPRVMGGAERDFEARYRPIMARGATEGVSPSVIRLTYRAPDEKDDGKRETMEAKECEAWGIAQFIMDAVEGGKLMVADGAGKARPARYGDFAVLFRTTTHQATLERFLRLLGVPFSSADLCAFFRDAPTNDLYAAMRAALYPGDRGSLAAYLRSPFANLSDASAAALLDDPEFGGWESLAGRGAALLSGEEADKAARAGETLRDVAAMADREPISSIVSYLWSEAGYREFVLKRPKNHPYLEYFDFLFGLADEADKGGRTLAAFIEGLERQIGEGERLRDSDPPREEGGGVRLMTIHKAKGLEFPVVIVPGIESKGSDRDGGELIHWWRDRALTFKTGADDGSLENFFFKSCEDERKEMAKAELKRLLYVACTRAECHLVFTECEPRNADLEGNSLRTMLDLALDASGAAIEGRPIPPRRLDEYYRLFSKADRPGRDPLAALAAARAAAPLDRPPVRREFSATELNAAYAKELGLRAEAPDAERDAGPVPMGAAFGTLVHAIIQRELDGADPALPWPAPLRETLEAQSDPGCFLEEARRTARSFLDSDLRKKISRAEWRRAECAFLLRKEGPGGEYFVNGVMDLVALVDGECLIVDYKTDAARVEGAYDLQMSLYREAAAGLTGASSVRSYLFYLRAGGAFEAVADPDPGPSLDSLS